MREKLFSFHGFFFCAFFRAAKVWQYKFNIFLWLHWKVLIRSFKQFSAVFALQLTLLTNPAGSWKWFHVG